MILNMNPVVKFTDFLYSYYLFQEGIQNETDFHLLSLWFNVVKKLENEVLFVICSAWTPKQILFLTAMTITLEFHREHILQTSNYNFL